MDKEQRIKEILIKWQHDVDSLGEHADKPSEIAHQINVLTRQERLDRPNIICLCGSSRFIESFAVLAWEFEKEGNITLGLHYLPPSYCREHIPDHLAEHEGVAKRMDELHMRKIDLADEVFVINVGGYIGESTSNEIAYAKKVGKPIKYLEAQMDRPNSASINSPKVNLGKPCIRCGYSDSYPSKKGERKCGACGRTLTSQDIKRGEIVKILYGMKWDSLYAWSVAGWPFGENSKMRAYLILLDLPTKS